MLRREHDPGRRREHRLVSPRATVESYGIGREFEDRAAAMGAANPDESSPLSMGIDGERFKYVADVLVEEAGIHPMLHRHAVAPIVEDGASAGSSPRASPDARRSSRSGSWTRPATPTSPPGRAPRPQDTPRGDARRVGDVLDDRRQQARFLDAVKADPQTVSRLGRQREWDIETDGKEDELFSPFLRKPFKQAVEAGLIPPGTSSRWPGPRARSTDQGDLTYLNLVHLGGIDGTDADDLTRGEIEGRQQAMDAIEGAARVHARLRGREAAQLRDDLGIRDTRKIDALYDLTERGRPRAGAVRRLDRHLPRVHRRLRDPHPADDRAVLPRAVPVARAPRGWVT